RAPPAPRRIHNPITRTTRARAKRRGIPHRRTSPRRPRASRTRRTPRASWPHRPHDQNRRTPPRPRRTRNRPAPTPRHRRRVGRTPPRRPRTTRRRRCHHAHAARVARVAARPPRHLENPPPARARGRAAVDRARQARLRRAARVAPPMNDAGPPAFTLRALHRRAMTDTWLKGLGTSGIMTAFFVGYFAVLRHPIFPVTTVPATWIDGLVGFQPWTLAAYFSLWFYVSLPAMMLTDRRQLIGYGVGCVALGGAGLAIFLRWPTTFAPPDIVWSRHPWIEFLKTTDSAGNACPSLHVAFAVFAALWFVRL